MGVAERAIQTMKNLMMANSDDSLRLAEYSNRALNVMRIELFTELKLTFFEIHRCKKPRNELSNLVEDGLLYPFDWSALSVSAMKKAKRPSACQGMEKETLRSTSC